MGTRWGPREFTWRSHLEEVAMREWSGGDGWSRRSKTKMAANTTELGSSWEVDQASTVELEWMRTLPNYSARSFLTNIPSLYAIISELGWEKSHGRLQFPPCLSSLSDGLWPVGWEKLLLLWMLLIRVSSQ